MPIVNVGNNHALNSDLVESITISRRNDKSTSVGFAGGTAGEEMNVPFSQIVEALPNLVQLDKNLAVNPTRITSLTAMDDTTNVGLQSGIYQNVPGSVSEVMEKIRQGREQSENWATSLEGSGIGWTRG